MISTFSNQIKSEIISQKSSKILLLEGPAQRLCTDVVGADTAVSHCAVTWVSIFYTEVIFHLFALFAEGDLSPYGIAADLLGEVKEFARLEDVYWLFLSMIGRRIPVDICYQSESGLDHNHFMDKKLEPPGGECGRAK